VHSCTYALQLGRWSLVLWCTKSGTSFCSGHFSNIFGWKRYNIHKRGCFMNPFFITICGLVILLGFEIRYRSTLYELNLLKIEILELEKEISKLNGAIKLKQNIFEEHGPS
jgi:hypothetical protein